MKYILTISFSFIAFLLLAQSGTTLDEYRYLSKGYAYQLEMGLDPTKSGYEIRKNYTAKDGTMIIGLYRTNTKLPQGLLFVLNDSNGKSYYQALPNPASSDNVLALYRQDQAQQFPTKVADRIAAAKDQYLFSIIDHSKVEDLAQVDSKTTQPSEYAQIPTTKNPRIYKKTLPKVQEDQLTAKGGTSIIPKEKPINTSMTGNPSEPSLGGNTIMGKLNPELMTRTMQVAPHTQNKTNAKGRVMIKFCADANGTVTYAKFTQRGSTTLNSQLKGLALAAVRKMRLAPSTSNEDCGTVGFDF